MLLRVGHRIYKLCAGLIVTVLVLLALYASLGRYYIGYLERYQEWAIAELERMSGLRIQADRLWGTWSALSPVLHVSQLRVYDGERLALAVEGARIKLGVVSGVINRRLEVSDIDARRLDAHLYQSPQGGWSFAGIPIAIGGGNSRSQWLLDTALALREVALQTTQVSLHYSDHADANFWSETLRLDGDGRFRRLFASFGVGESQPAQVLAELHGDPRQPDFAADAYLQLNDSHLATLAPLFGDLSGLADGTVNGELWLSWRPGAAARVTANFSTPRLAVGAFWKQPDQFLENLEMQFGGRYENGRWQLWFPRANGRWGQSELNLSGMRIAQVSQEPVLFQLQLDSLDLAEYHTLLQQAGVLPAQVAETLAELAPEGRLRQLVVNAPLDFALRRHFQLRARLDGVSIRPWHGAPGVIGVNGFVQAGAEGGRVMVDSPALTLSFPQVYAQPLGLQAVRAHVDWRIENDRVYVDSGPIAARDDNAHLGALLALDLPVRAPAERTPENAPRMTLSVGIRNADVGIRDKYIPEVLDAGLRRWLRRSIVGGHLDSGAFLYRGSLRAQDHLERSVQLFFDVDDARLDYSDDWPELRDVDALVVVDDARVQATASRARLLDHSEANQVQVTVTGSDDGVNLRVDAQVRATVDDGLRVLRETPLRQRLGSTFDSWKGAGAIDADLKLDIPLGETGEGSRQPHVEVDARIAATRLRLDGYGLKLTDVRGPLHFDSDSGLGGSGISGQLFGKSLSLDVAQEGSKVRLDIRGRAAGADLRTWLQQPALTFFEGETDFGVDIRVGDGSGELVARSDLRGMTIDLPEPYGKAADAERAFMLTMPLGVSQTSMDMALAEQLHLGLQLGTGGALAAARITLGGAEVQAPQPGLFLVNGRIAEASLTDWQRALDRFIAARETLRASSADASAGGTVPLQLEGLRIDTLDVFGQDLKQVTLSGGDGDGSWRFVVDSDMLTGTVTLPSVRDQPLRLVLQRLALAALEPGAAANSGHDGVPSAFAQIDPRKLIDLDVDIDHLVIGDEDWGQLGFALRTNPDGARFGDVRGELRGIQFSRPGARPLELQWHRFPAGDISALRGSLGTADIGDVLQRWDLGRVLESRGSQFDLNLGWPGTPMDLSVLNMHGDITLRMQNGRFLKGSDAADSTLKMVGIFNFANILRRLQLDFRDVFKRGIHYDELQGRMRFSDGIMTLAEPLQIAGPSSQFRLTGQVDFNTDATDMELVATLPIGTNLPWIAALVAGLPAAAGAYVFSKVFEEQVDRYSSAVYDVSGRWQEPTLEFDQLFGDELGDIEPLMPPDPAAHVPPAPPPAVEESSP